MTRPKADLNVDYSDSLKTLRKLVSKESSGG